MKKVTRATIKAFIKKHLKEGNLYIKSLSSFDGMVDMVVYEEGVFQKAQEEEQRDNTLGVQGAWFVGSSRDYFEGYVDIDFEGYKVFNACGSFILATNRK
jgi:hypothetical protein